MANHPERDLNDDERRAAAKVARAHGFPEDAADDLVDRMLGAYRVRRGAYREAHLAPNDGPGDLNPAEAMRIYIRDHKPEVPRAPREPSLADHLAARPRRQYTDEERAQIRAGEALFGMHDECAPTAVLCASSAPPPRPKGRPPVTEAELEGAVARALRDG